MLKNTSRNFCFRLQQMINEIWCECKDLFLVEHGRKYDGSSKDDYILLNKSYIKVKTSLEEAMNVILNNEFDNPEDPCKLTGDQMDELSSIIVSGDYEKIASRFGWVQFDIIDAPNHEETMCKNFFMNFIISKMITRDLRLSEIISITGASDETVRNIITGNINDITLEDLERYSGKLK